MYFKYFLGGVPDEIKARGPRAKLAYENALKKGEVKLYRARIMLMGKDRAGKTSLKKSFLDLPFDPQEDSTDGIQVDPSKFEVKVDQVKNWKLTNENLGVSQFMSDLTKMVAREIQEDGDKEEDDRGGDEKVDDNDVKEQEEKEVKEDGKEKGTPGDLWRVFSEVRTIFLIHRSLFSLLHHFFIPLFICCLVSLEAFHLLMKCNLDVRFWWKVWLHHRQARGLFPESPGNVLGPEGYFVYALFTLKIKVSIILTMIQ